MKRPETDVLFRLYSGDLEDNEVLSGLLRKREDRALPDARFTARRRGSAPTVPGGGEERPDCPLFLISPDQHDA